MEIAILYICTGRYNQFFDGFYKSSERFFLPNIPKDYFVFTDNLDLCNYDNVHLQYKKCEGFPKDSLFRFEMFLRIKHELQKYDYIYFFNSNTQFLQPILPKEILPSNNGNGLVGAYWPGGYKLYQHAPFFPYERNKKSTAYIPPFQGEYHYYMGGINGGAAKPYLQMIEVCANNIQIDYLKGIVAYVHDESHINHYFHMHNPFVLTKEYCWPEEWPSPDFKPKIIFRDKVKVDIAFQKKSPSLFKRIKRVINRFERAIQWYV